MPVTPVTPVTLVNTEGLTSLHGLVKQDTSRLDEVSKQRLQRRVQKLASAAKISFAWQGLRQDHNRLLCKINNESKVRLATRAIILGKAKVMRNGNLEQARAKRAATDKEG
jgi:hypothetical protein